MGTPKIYITKKLSDLSNFLYGKRRTKYRVRQTGLGKEWLEYKQFLSWHPVPTPYCSNIYYREFCDAYNGWLNNSFDWFVKT
jgi:hypothetical protein